MTGCAGCATESRQRAAPPRTSPTTRSRRLYDAWSRSVTEDVDFYVDEAKRSRRPGRRARRRHRPDRDPDRAGGRRRDRRRLVGGHARGLPRGGRATPASTERLDLRARRPPRAAGRRARRRSSSARSARYLHLADDAERLARSRAAHDLLLPGGRLVFDVFTPAQDDIEETHGRWLEREPGIFERADWDDRRADADALGHGARRRDARWRSRGSRRGRVAHAARRRAGFEVEACYGWFDRRPYAGGEDTIWIARRPTV